MLDLYNVNYEKKNIIIDFFTLYNVHFFVI